MKLLVVKLSQCRFGLSADELLEPDNIGISGSSQISLVLFIQAISACMNNTNEIIHYFKPISGKCRHLKCATHQVKHLTLTVLSACQYDSD